MHGPNSYNMLFFFLCNTKDDIWRIFQEFLSISQWGHEVDFKLMMENHSLWNSFIIKCFFADAKWPMLIGILFLLSLMFSSCFLHNFFSFSLSVSLSLSFSHLWTTENTDAQPSWLENRSKYPLLTVVEVKSLPAFHERPYCLFLWCGSAFVAMFCSLPGKASRWRERREG